MTPFLLLLKYFFWSVLRTLLQVVFLSVTKLLLEYNFRVLFTPLAPGHMSQGMSFPMQWCDATVQPYGDGRPAQLKSLRKKLLSTKKAKFISYCRKFS